MLAGQVISLGDSIIISLTGLLIVMLELAFLAVFIQIMSRLLAAVVKRKEKSPSQIETAASEEDDELAVIMTAVLEETGWPMEEVVFRSVVRIQ